MDPPYVSALQKKKTVVTTVTRSTRVHKVTLPENGEMMS